MNFIEKISQLRVNWDGQSAFRIDDVFQLINEADENYCLMKNEILSFPLLNNGNGNITIDRISLQQYWNSDCTVGSKILITLFWGGLHKTQNFQSSFIREIDKNMNLIYGFEKDFFDKGIEELFKDFESENKIEGVGYAFFSKFFQFAIPNSSFIICDQWTMKAVASYLISNKNYLKLNEIFTLSINNKNQINIGLRQKNKSVYKSYLLFIEVFHEITRELTLVLNRIGNDVRVAEEILFGWDRRIKNDEYDNPRHYYQEILYTYLNSQKQAKVDNEILQVNEKISEVFIFKQPSNAYFALRVSADPKHRKKIGYFDNNAWLCMQKKYINLLKGIVWQEGNTKGGPESHKVQFDSIVELILELEKNNLTCIKLNC